MIKDIIDFSPQELNSFLLEKFNLNLYPFSCFLKSVISLSFVQSEFKPSPAYEHFLKQEEMRIEKFAPAIKELELERINHLKQQYYSGIKIKLNYGQYDPKVLRGLKKRLLNLKKKIIETMIDFDVYFEGESDQRKRYKTMSHEEFEKRFTYEYELESFFSLVDDYIADIDNNLDVLKKGIPTNKRNLLISMWALFLIEKNQKPDWTILVDIFNWFWKILFPYKLYEDLKPPKKDEFINPDYLKNQFYKYKKRWKTQYKFHRSWQIDMNGGIIVLGQQKNEIDYYDKRILDLFISGFARPNNKTFLPFLITYYKENPNFNNLIIFPDFSCFFM